MSQKHRFIKVVSIGTAIALGQASITVAQQAPDTSVPETTQSDSTDIIKPAQPAIPNTELKKLNPSSDLLSLPSNPNEVTVDAQKPITLEQALEISFKNNKDIQEAKLQVESSEFAVKQQKAALYPTLNVGSGLTYSNSLFLDNTSQQRIDQSVEDSLANNPNNVSEDQIRTNAETRFGDPSQRSFQFSGNLGIDYDIYNGGQRGASIRSAEKQLSSDELDLERVVEEARLETSRNYYELQNSDAQVEIQRAAVEDARQTLKDADLLKKAGLGTKFESLQAEVELAQAEQQLTTAIANQNIARRQLADTLSVSDKTDLATADPIQEVGVWDLGLPETIVSAFKNREELKQLLLQKGISEDQRTIARSLTRPTLSASADYILQDDFEDDFDIVDNYQLGLNVRWPLFDGGESRARAAQAEKDGQTAETRFANQRNQIRFDVENAFYQLESNKSNIITTTKGVQLAEESLRLARLRFQSGVGTQTEVIDAQTELTRARGDRLSSITDYNQSFADLMRQVSSTPIKGLKEDVSEQKSPEDASDDELSEDVPVDELQEAEPDGESPEDVPVDELQEAAPDSQAPEDVPADELQDAVPNPNEQEQP